MLAPVFSLREISTGAQQISLKNLWKFAGVAQLVEQLICNQPAGGSIPLASSFDK